MKEGGKKLYNLLLKTWDVDKLKNHLIIKGRIGWKGLKKSEYSDNGYIIISGNQIINDDIDWNNCGRISEFRYKESPEIMLRENDILMTKDGTIGKLAYIEQLRENATVASGVFVIRNNSTKLMQKYAYIYLRSKIFKNFINSRIEGSVIPHLYQRDINEIEIAIPEIHEQSVIVNIINSLDNKIKLNNKINNSLEKISKELFKYWFVDFEFPNEQGKPYKYSGGEFIDSELGKIPKGWEIQEYKSLADIFSGKGLPKDKITSDGVYPIYGANGIISHTNDYLFHEELIITGRVGTLGKILLVNEKVWISDNVLISRPKDRIFTYFIYFTLRKFNLSNLNRGSTQPLITKTDISKLKIVIPTREFFINFDKIIRNAQRLIDLLSKQNQILSQIRDTLLPKLITGKIRVNLEDVKER